MNDSAADTSSIYTFLELHSVAFERYAHPAVFTCEEAKIHVPALGAVQTKNLFARDKKGHRHFLITTDCETSVDLTALARLLECSRLSLASPERLMRHLGVRPGSVTLLGLIHDTARAVEVIIDQRIWAQHAFLCHPLVNTETLLISKPEIARFLTLTAHEPRILALPLIDATHVQKPSVGH